MHINDDHMFHGAALTQIAEHPAFTAINAFKDHGDKSRCAFRINDGIGTYIKYASEPKGKYGEYIFTFQQAHLEEFQRLREKSGKAFAVLVCIKDKEICVLSADQLNSLIAIREKKYGGPEDQYQIIVTAEANKQFRVYVNSPGVKGKKLGEIKVKRKAFPDALFIQMNLVKQKKRATRPSPNRPLLNSGATSRGRTEDLRITNASLCQLS